ncbi:MAG: leucine-rich repeat domain-containing protein, partial [Bacteroidota bacterium]
MRRLLTLPFLLLTILTGFGQSLDLSYLGVTDWPSDLPQDIQSVDLSHNQMEQIKVDTNRSTIQQLDLSYNRLDPVSLFPALEQLPLLRNLNLNTCRLGFLSDRIGNLNALQDLEVSDNGIQSLPERMLLLQALQHLNLSHNLIDSLPAWFSKFPDLNYLDLSGNPLLEADLPDCDSLVLQNFSTLNFRLPNDLKYLDLSGWSSPIPPPVLKTLESLETLVIKHPKYLDWTGLFDLLSQNKALKTLVIADHNLLVFPNGVERLEQLQILILEGHRLEALPLGIQKSKRLKEIHVAQCPDMKADFVFSQLLASRKMRGVLWLDQVAPDLRDTLGELIQPSIYYWEDVNEEQTT